MSWRLRIAQRLALATGVAALVVVGAGWSTFAWGSAPTAHKVHHSAPPSDHGSLSGKWSGSYSGTYGGTFRLTWTQSGHNLNGTIMISGFKDETTSIRGSVQGAAIRFGTVGSEPITYSGSVSGSSMSGTWQIEAGGRSLGGGSWKASRAS
jgi:hypothetical protein